MDATGDKQRAGLAKGIGLALTSALAFGLTTPIVRRAGIGVGPFATAFLLYAGASLATAPALLRPTARPLTRSNLVRVTLVGALGAAVAPTLFAWGLQRSSGTSASILLNMEAVFTVVLAWALYQEWIGWRSGTAVALMFAGGCAVFGASAHSGAPGSVTGLAVLLAAVFAWSLDSALSRPLSDRDPARVVVAKATLGSALSFALALFARDSWPTRGNIVFLLACGAVGYGVSLRLYLLAQRSVGAARTASVFSLAPFFGAGLAWILGDREETPALLMASALFGVALWLHMSERHGHEHAHENLVHTHAHHHDDGHHAHPHDDLPIGEHVHEHRHERLTHSHDHVDDIHHRHHS